MVKTKIVDGVLPARDADCPNLASTELSIQGALGNMELTYVYYVEIDESVVVVAVSPTKNGKIIMNSVHKHLPLFILYLALDDGIAVDLTDELFDQAQAIRRDLIFEAAGACDDIESIQLQLLQHLVHNTENE